jgi:hypothetical protein
MGGSEVEDWWFWANVVTVSRKITERVRMIFIVCDPREPDEEVYI